MPGVDLLIFNESLAEWAREVWIGLEKITDLWSMIKPDAHPAGSKSATLHPTGKFSVMTSGAWRSLFFCLINTELL